MASLYIHIPFCQSKCYFCSFVVSIGKENYVDSYLGALTKEAKSYRRPFVETIYIGGGTPSFLSQEQLKHLIRMIRENFQFSAGCELTIEANPENIDCEKAKLLYELGVNRISLGVQSLNDKYLKFLGRPHNRQGALEAFSNLRKAGFLNINLDLMFSFPGQGLPELEEDVHAIADLGSEHLSLYTLTIEEGSKFYKQNMKLENDLCQREQYVRVAQLLEGKGFYQYEVSNFARPGKESRHNRVYWQGGDYIGLGIGAHSHLNSERFWNTANLHSYISKVNENTKPREGHENLNPEERLMETLLFGLRMTDGVEILKLEEKFERKLPEEKKNAIDRFIKEGFLAREGTRLKATSSGRLVLDELCSRLI